MKINDVLEIEISHLASNGKGVAHLDNPDNPALRFSIFVESAVPGDKLKAKVKKVKKVFIEADILEIIKASKDRVESVCKYFGKCGACEWLHINYNLQIKEKENLLKFYFQRNNIDISNIDLEVISSNENLFYRKKIRLSNGFYKRKSKEKILVDECYLIDKKFWPYLKIKRDVEETFGIDESSGDVKQDKSFYFYNDFKLAYFPSSFVQSNFEMNRKMIDIILNESKNILEDKDDVKILDLYSGNGNFSIPLSKDVSIKKVIAVEGSNIIYNLMLENMKTNDALNIDPYNLDVRDFLKRRSKFDLVLLDPPRSGSNEILYDISKQTNNIIYISCNPEVLVKEIKSILPSFVIKKVYLLDLFPHTRHFEVILVLSKE